jgi:hypothetical protein
LLKSRTESSSARCAGGADVAGRYRVPCRYQGDQAGKSEAAMFVCGVIAATLGADVDCDTHSDDFDVLILDSVIPPDPARLNYWRRVTAANLERIAAGCSVEIGKPESISAEPEASE